MTGGTFTRCSARNHTCISLTRMTLLTRYIIRAVIADLGRLLCRRAGIQQNDFMCAQQPRDLHRHFLAASRRARNIRVLRHIRRHGVAQSAQCLDAFRDEVHQFNLRLKMLVKQEMQWMKGQPGGLPMMFLRTCRGGSSCPPVSGLTDSHFRGRHFRPARSATWRWFRKPGFPRLAG